MEKTAEKNAGKLSSETGETVVKNDKNLEEMTDEQIVLETREKNKEAYVQIVKRYEKKLLRYAFNIVGDNSLAADVVQDAFIKAYENLQGFDVSKKFSSWIYRIVHNEAINLLKKQKRFVFNFDFSFFDRSGGNNGRDSSGGSAETPEQEYDRQEIVDKVQASLSELPLKYKEALTLYYLEEKSYDEISDILRIPIGTVGTRINRGKKLLRKIVA